MRELNGELELLWEHLKEEVQTRFGFQVMKSTQINRGYLNQKWKIETDQGIFLVKQYNKERIKKYDLKTIHTALRTQNRSFLADIPCPELLSNEGNLLHKSSSGELFTVMRFMKGSLIKPGEASPEQMESLGQEIGKLHRLLNDGTLPAKSKTVFQIPALQDRLDYWGSVGIQCEEQDLDHLRTLIELQRKATINMGTLQLEHLTPGWCHRDLWVDNLLFSGENITAILDFDRLDYDFIELDIGRIIISTCLHDDTINVEAVHAFLKGYGNTNKLSIERLVLSLKLVWYMESTWWVSVELHEGEPPKRFQHEMVWLAQHLDELEKMLGWKKEAATFMF
ncbi:phosphotransferase [Fictibacillus sp. UD]|uniref:phosphotransferase n=1 Tax=Fictibacillus sp. UD TaxID=3038777 RepID=UPI003744D3CF